MKQVYSWAEGLFEDAMARSLQLRSRHQPDTKSCNGVCTMYVSIRYTPIGASRSLAPEKVHYYMMNCLLYSRVECGFPSNADSFDEDVNVYLAGLLTALVDGERAARARSPLALDDLSVADAAAAAGRPRERYELYRASADRILVSLGIFKNARGRRPDSRSRLHLSDAAYVGRGEAYYALAQSYAVQTFRRSNAVSACLGKLSRDLERYLAVLSTLRGEYLNICETLSEGALYHLERSAAHVERRGDIASQYDHFLDAYSNYLRSGSPEARERLIAACETIRTIDPSFSFDIEKRESVTSL